MTEPRNQLSDVIKGLDRSKIGTEVYDLAERLFPICRSITGEGFRQSLDVIRDRVPIEIHSVPSGTKVFDWTVPSEWNIRDAWIRDPNGKKIVDFKEHNLHVVGYSRAVNVKLSLDQLRPHLHYLTDHPDWIPYRTSYYHEDWGFCISRRLYDDMSDGEYEVVIDSTLEPGALVYGECLVPGRTAEEILISCHSCHPSMANDNASGMAMTTVLADVVHDADVKYGLRFLFVPGTVGAIAWLAGNRSNWQRVRGGLVVACVGDRGCMTYKRSKQGDAEIDRAVEHVLKSDPADHEIEDFTPYGYDERQFNSPGINIPVGRLTRTPNGRYPEYHTSADDMSLISPDRLGHSLVTYGRILQVINDNRSYLNTNPCCEPQLGSRGLYGTMGGLPDPGQASLAMLWLLNMSDGNQCLLDIAERSGIPFHELSNVARVLENVGLLQSTQGAVESVTSNGIES